MPYASKEKERANLRKQAKRRRADGRNSIYYFNNKDKFHGYYLKYRQKTMNSSLLKKYGITIEEYNKILSDQGFSCAICMKHISELKKSICVDHDHNTNRVRGLLCSSCNAGVGLLGDTLDGVRNALRYMETHYG